MCSDTTMAASAHKATARHNSCSNLPVGVTRPFQPTTPWTSSPRNVTTRGSRFGNASNPLIPN